jgi:amidase
MDRQTYSSCDAMELAKLIRSGETSAEEVQAVARDTIAELGGLLNALADGPWDEPSAYNKEGAFAGVPFVLKDLGCAMAGIPSCAGSYLTGPGLVEMEDCHLVKRFRSAGLAAMALSTTDEMGFGANTFTPRYGRTLNPWDVDLSVGGSSGGSAALVASGAIPVAHASDGGGSIRIPASVAGLVGLKPSRGRVPFGPGAQEGQFGLSSHFVLTRSVRDSALMLDSVIGSFPGDRFIPAPPRQPWIKEVQAEAFQPLRVAVVLDGWGHLDPDWQVKTTVKAAARALEAEGFSVDQPVFKFDWERTLRAIEILGCTTAAISLAQIERTTGRRAEECGVQPIILSYRDEGLRLGALDIGEALASVNAVSRAFGALFQHYDILLLPNMTAVSWKPEDFNPIDPPMDALSWMQRMFEVFCYNPVFNMTGMPAMSVPVGWSDDGFPIGVQIAADMNNEWAIFRAAAILERALPWSHRRPSVFAVEAN